MRTSERPTCPPPFDVERYAKDSDARIKSLRPPRAGPGDDEPPDDALGPASEVRPVTRSHTAVPLVSSPNDEAWARTTAGAPVVVVSGDELRRLPLDHCAGFLLSLMDGTLDLEMLVEVSAMGRPQALRLVRNLFEAGVVAFR